MAGGVIDASESATESATNDGDAAPRTIEDLMTSLSQVDGDMLVQKLPGGRYIAYLPSHGRRGRATLQLVGSHGSGREIGRASCRERACQFVLISVVAGSLKQKTEQYEQQSKANIQQEE